MRHSLLLVALLLLTAGSASAAGEEHPPGHQHVAGLAGIMEENRTHFAALVEKAYLTGVQRRLQAEDFAAIRLGAEAVARIAGKVRSGFSRGEEFDRLATELEEHAGKAAAAAGAGSHPKLNVEIGEMAEYCAACHDAFRW
jgi:cytochrome c556